MDRRIHYFQDRTEYGSYDPIFPGYEKIGKIRFPDNLIFSKIRDPGCRGSIRLVKTVCLDQFSDFIIIKNYPKSNFYIKFVEKTPKSPNLNVRL